MHHGWFEVVAISLSNWRQSTEKFAKLHKTSKKECQQFMDNSSSQTISPTRNTTCNIEHVQTNSSPSAIRGAGGR